MKLQSCLLAFLVVLGGCSVIDEGEIDYARTLPNSYQSALQSQVCDPSSVDLTRSVRMGDTRACYSALHRKYSDTKPIKKGETIAVYLMQGFLEYSPEGRNLIETLKWSPPNAEVAVLVNVCEQGKTGCSVQFGDAADDASRVVFFTKGAKAVQYLNFSYMPVYGPITYDGGPIFVNIKIIELDNLSESELNLIKTLADLGSTAYPPASEAISVLDTLGTTFLKSNLDDVIFSYSLTLVPESADSDVDSPVVSEGNYAFIRKNTVKNQQEDEVWRDVLFDELSGRLVRKCIPGPTDEYFEPSSEDGSEVTKYNFCKKRLPGSDVSYKDYRDTSYLSFQVKTGLSAREFDNVQRFSELKTALSTENADVITSIDDKLSAFTNDYKKREKKADIDSILMALKSQTSSVDNYDPSVYVLTVLELYKKLEEEQKDRHACDTTPTPSCDKILSSFDIGRKISDLSRYALSLDIATDISGDIKLDSTKSSLIPAGQTQADLAKTLSDAANSRIQSLISKRHALELEDIARLKREIEKLPTSTDGLDDKKTLFTQKLFNTLASLMSMLDIYHSVGCTGSPSQQRCFSIPSNSDLDQLLSTYRGYFPTADQNAIPKNVAAFTAAPANFPLSGIKAVVEKLKI